LQLSSDSGVSWSPLPAPTRDGIAYPRAYSIVLSPSFAEDRTLFVFASQVPPVAATSPERMAFRSTDRGQTWEPLSIDARDVDVVASRPRLLRTGPFLAHASTLRLTAPTEWLVWGRALIRCRRDLGCRAGCNVGFNCARIGLWQGQLGSWRWLAGSISTDLGQTWQPLALPDGSVPRVSMISPDFLHDGVIFTVTEKHGVWVYGPGVQPPPSSGLLDPARGRTRRGV